MAMAAPTRWFARLTVVLALVGFAAEPASGKVAQETTIDFSTIGFGTVFDPLTFQSEGLVFPVEQCAPACGDWVIGMVQGDEVLTQPPGLGPIEGRFTRPVSELSLLVAPSLQGTATYVLRVYAANGRLLAERSLTVTQDFGDPQNTGFGFFSIGVTDLARHAKSFVLDNVFVRSSFPGTTSIPYGVASITYSH
jgi:hypothetical protein